jgi:hypothetical protein
LKPRLQKHKTGLRRFNSSIREGGFRELVAANLFAGLDIRRAGYSPGWIFAGLDIRRAGYPIALYAFCETLYASL